MPTSVSHAPQALRARAREAWSIAEPAAKLAAVRAIGKRLPAPAHEDRAIDAGALRAAGCGLAAGTDRDAGPDPGRPARPVLVDPRRVPLRPTGSAVGRAALLHAIAHIEFNAINLALDAAWRFDAMPDEFLFDWLSVAVDEARHFAMVSALLALGGHAYGDFDAHDGLWRAAWRTRGDVLARMAVVPRVFEARGLDATPPIQERLRAAGDARAVEVLQVILDEEVRHVRLGDAWFRRLCGVRGVEPEACFRALLAEHEAPRPRAPLNRGARLAAGFTDSEIAWLQGSL